MDDLVVVVKATLLTEDLGTKADTAVDADKRRVRDFARDGILLGRRFGRLNARIVRAMLCGLWEHYCSEKDTEASKSGQSLRCW